jgi:hypothetical protein
MEEQKALRTVDVARLRDAINVLFDHVLTTCGITEVAIDEPLYWAVLSDEARVMNAVPSAPGVGNLNDDLDFVLAVLAPDAEPAALTLTEVAPLLAYIGEAVSFKIAPQGS